MDRTKRIDPRNVINAWGKVITRPRKENEFTLKQIYSRFVEEKSQSVEETCCETEHVGSVCVR